MSSVLGFCPQKRLRFPERWAVDLHGDTEVDGAEDARAVERAEHIRGNLVLDFLLAKS